MSAVTAKPTPFVLCAFTMHVLLRPKQSPLLLTSRGMHDCTSRLVLSVACEISMTTSGTTSLSNNKCCCF